MHFPWLFHARRLSLCKLLKHVDAGQDEKSHSVGELLILVIRCASPDLQFRAVYSAPAGDVQAFVVKDTDCTAGECPLLSRSVSTTLDCNGGSVGVGRRSQAFG